MIYEEPAATLCSKMPPATNLEKIKGAQKIIFGKAESEQDIYQNPNKRPSSHETPPASPTPSSLLNKKKQLL